MIQNLYDITITFTEPLLGATPLDPEIFTGHVTHKGGEVAEDELETVEEAIEKGTTGFHKLDGGPILYDYVILGMFKDFCGMLRRVPDSKSAKLTAYKKVIDGLITPTPRRISLKLAGPIEFLERPLRAQTAQGERIALARSEMAPVGSSFSFSLDVLGKEVDEELLREWFDYGARRGLGQWRNGGYGRYTYTLVKRETK